MAAQDGTSGWAGAGQTALRQSWRTLPSVSWPSSVVRSSMEMASRMPAALESVLIERLPSSAARSSTPTRSTCGSLRMGAGYGPGPRAARQPARRADAFVVGGWSSATYCRRFTRLVACYEGHNPGGGVEGSTAGNLGCPCVDSAGGGHELCARGDERAKWHARLDHAGTPSHRARAGRLQHLGDVSGWTQPAAVD